MRESISTNVGTEVPQCETIQCHDLEKSLAVILLPCGKTLDIDGCNPISQAVRSEDPKLNRY